MWINFSQHNPRSNKWRHALTLKSKSFPERWFDRENEELQQPRKTGNNNRKMTKKYYFPRPLHLYDEGKLNVFSAAALGQPREVP